MADPATIMMIAQMAGQGAGFLGGMVGQNQQQWAQQALINVLNTMNGANQAGLGMANQTYDPLRNSLLGQLAYQSGYAFGDANNPGIMYQLGNGMQNFGSGLQGMFMDPYQNDVLSQIRGQQWNMNDAYTNSFLGQMGDVMNNRGVLSPDMASVFQQYQALQNNPYLNNLGDTGSNILSQGGQTAYSQNAADRGTQVMNAGGQNALSNSMIPFAENYLQQNGYTPQLNQIFNTGQGYASNPTQNTLGPFGQSALGQGNQYLDNAQAYGGATMDRALGGGGYTNGLAGMSQQGYDLLNAPTMTPGLAAEMGRGLDLSYDTGYTPEIYQGLNAGYDMLGQSGLEGGAGVALNQAGGLMGDSGYTDSINSGIGTAQGILGTHGMTPELQQYFQHSMDLYNGAPGVLRPMNEAISQARDQAATASQQQYEKMAQQAMLRGGGAGVIGSGLQNNRMGEFADQRSQAEAQALRDAAKNQEALFLQQELGGGDNAGKALTEAAANMKTGSDLYQGMESAAASRHNASVGAGASLAASAANAAAQLRAQALQSGASLINGLNSTAANRYGTSLGASTSMLANANNDETQRYLGNLQYGTNLIQGAENQGTQRYGQELGAGTSLLNPQVGSNLIDSGYGNYSNLYGTNLSQGLNAMRSGAGLANDLVSNYTNLIPNLDQLNNQRVSIYGNLANEAQQNDLSRMQFGGNAVNNYYGNLLGNAAGQNNFMGQASQNYFNASNGMNQGYGNLFNLYNNMYGNELGAQQYGTARNTAYGNQMNSMFGNQNNLLQSMFGSMGQSNNTLGGLVGEYLNYARSGLGGQVGLFNPMFSLFGKGNYFGTSPFGGDYSQIFTNAGKMAGGGE